MITAKTMQHKIRQTGFSALELLIGLLIISLLLYFGLNLSDSIINQTKAQAVSQQAYDYSKIITRYIQVHRSLLQEVLFDLGRDTGKIITIPMAILKSEGFINQAYPEMNNLKQYPCVIIYGENQQLQAILYYRSDGNDIHLDQQQLHSGLQHTGSMLGLYTDGKVFGSARDWNLTADFVKSKFISQGSAFLLQTHDMINYQCRGRQIASNSYVVNISAMLTLANKLPKDDTLHQHPDLLYSVDEIASNNMANDDLNMDYQEVDQVRRQSNVIFQINDKCHMNPRKPATMQDYDPSYNGQLPENWHRSNNLGCKNKQLSIQARRDNNNINMVVTGFNPSAVDHVSYVGDISASSIQPTAQVAIGTPCERRELGKMARQIVSNEINDINNLYISQVQCMLNPFCPNSINNSSGRCYMPINSVSINIPGFNPQVRDQDGAIAPIWRCPSGLYPELNTIQVLNHPRPTTHPVWQCDWGIHQTPWAECRSWWQNICIGFVIRTKWQQGGGGLCRSHGVIDTWGGTFRINCTNDASKMPVIMVQNGAS